jgi:putative transposase
VSAKYAFIDGEKDTYPIVRMCAWMGVSTSGYYEWVCHERGRELVGR